MLRTVNTFSCDDLRPYQDKSNQKLEEFIVTITQFEFLVVTGSHVFDTEPWETGPIHREGELGLQPSNSFETKSLLIPILIDESKSGVPLETGRNKEFLKGTGYSQNPRICVDLIYLRWAFCFFIIV